MAIKQGELCYIDELRDYHQKFISLMHGMGPYVIKVTDGGTVKINGEIFPGKVNGKHSLSAPGN